MAAKSCDVKFGQVNTQTDRRRSSGPIKVDHTNPVHLLGSGGVELWVLSMRPHHLCRPPPTTTFNASQRVICSK